MSGRKWKDKGGEGKGRGNFAGKKKMEKMIRDEALLGRAKECIDGLREFREERERCKRYTYGDQWIDYVEDCGVRVREEDYIRSQGNMPLKNNLIRRLVRNVLGVFRNQLTLPRCEARDPTEESRAATLNCLLEYNQQLNRLDELYSRTMEEFLISGMAVHKKWYGRRGGRSDCWTDLVSPARFFFDRSSRDFRGSDVTIVGEVHDMRFEDLCATFARDPDDIAVLAGLYPGAESGEDTMRCRVIEVWERRRIMRLLCRDWKSGRMFRAEKEEYASLQAGYGDRLNIRWVFDEQWQYSFLTPDGAVLSRGVSPYAHGRHPYVFKAYPFIDGEIHSFVNDIIDQQKLTNRLISMYDWILRASAKGVLLFPEGSLPEGVDINDVADEWGRFNGVIVYRPRAGVPLPQQVSSKSADIGITQLLEIQMKMMEDISGVNGALQGKLESTSMSGTLYDQQTRNSLTALADLLKSFDDFVALATETDAVNISRYYTPRRIGRITGHRAGYSADLRPTPTYGDATSDFRFRK